MQSEPYALAAALAPTQPPLVAQTPAQGGNGAAKVIVLALSVVVAAALVLTYRKKPAR